MMLSKFLDPKNDLAFKRIFGTERNKDILIHFLNDIFARTTNPIEEVTFLKTSQNPEIAALRNTIVDVMCRDTEGRRFIIEMQVGREPGFVKRAQNYAARAYIDQRDQGIAYKDLDEVIFLGITSFILFPEKEKYLSYHKMLDIETHEHDLKDFSYAFLELPKFKKTIKQLTTVTEKWAYFFKNAKRTSEKELEGIIGSDQIIQKAFEELNRYSWTVEELRFYDSVDMKQGADKAILEGAYEEGKAEGMVKGEREKARAIAIKLLNAGVDVNTIAASTDLSPEQIQALKNGLYKPH